MLSKLVSDKYFYKGFSNYISTYDGKAATIDQFVDKILEHNKEIDPEEFKVLYKQNGTPKVKFKRIWDQKDEKLTIQASQSNPCLLYTSPSPRDWMVSRMPSSA